MYAFVTGGTIQAESVQLPDSGRRLDTNEWVLGLPTAPVAAQQSTGWYVTVDTARPSDTATLTSDRTVTLVGGIPTVTWVQRNKTAGELTLDATTANRQTVTTQAASAIAINQTFTAIASPTNAQVVAQVKALTRQNNGIIRLLLNQLDGTD